jgi:tRNA pseudouridine55 synthase
MKSPLFEIDTSLSILENVQKGQLVLIDKPLHWTSFQVVNKMRYLLKQGLHIKKIKVGHAGTLDPLATGLLIICIGKKTKEIESFIGQKKVYTGTFTLGATTPSFDLETEIDARYKTDHIDEELIKSTARTFLGEQMQTPPIFSAKKIDGKRAYESARKGEKIKMRPNPITIFKFDITDIVGDEVHFLIESSKGTYIRSIAYDFGKKLNSGAYLSSLRRIQSGDFTIDNAISIEEYESQLKSLTKGI